MKSKNLASHRKYSPVSQLTLPGFETPFLKQLDSDNRWVKFSRIIPWDEIVGIYEKTLKSHTGRPALNGRVIMGAMIIKHYCDFSDEETILNIQENMYMQYFCGYSSYDPTPAFDSSLFVEIRDRLGLSGISAMNEAIANAEKTNQTTIKEAEIENTFYKNDKPNDNNETESVTESEAPQKPNKGRVLYDATVCPQEIAYPTDLNLLNDCREKSELMIDFLYEKTDLKVKPRTYRQEARKVYLKTAQKKIKSKNTINVAIGKQLRYLKRNFGTITKLLDLLGKGIPFDNRMLKYYWVIQCCYDQQLKMYKDQTHTIEDRIVSIHQPHVRPIVRGKANAKVEFGSKINLSMVDGLSFIDELSWDAFNEGVHLIDYIEQYKARHGFYPKEVLADKIYCTRENRKKLKDLSISLIAKPLGRPKAVPEQHVSPGERNEIEGKFGQGKRGYGMDKIRAKLKPTSEAWVAMIVLVLNLVKLAGRVPLALVFQYKIWVKKLSQQMTSLAELYKYCTFPRLLASD
jgi:transposase, IS5 family